MSGVKVIFAHDTEVALQAAAALVNTLDDDHELLPDDDALDEFVRTWGWTGERRHDAAELRNARVCASSSPASRATDSTSLECVVVMTIIVPLLRSAVGVIVVGGRAHELWSKWR